VRRSLREEQQQAGAGRALRIVEDLHIRAVQLLAATPRSGNLLRSRFRPAGAATSAASGRVLCHAISRRGAGGWTTGWHGWSASRTARPDVGRRAIASVGRLATGPPRFRSRGRTRPHDRIGVPAASTPRSSLRRRLDRPATYDGTVFADALTADQIPLGAGIIAVCDAYNATTNERPCRPAMGHNAAIAELQRCAGTR
jgi:hypothetical protein